MHTKSIVSSSLGNLLEWYDFGLFAIYAPLFSRLFFPSQDPHIGLLLTFSVLAIGFLARPLGAFLFGYLGDTQGRAKTLRFSILMISIPTLLIGCLPTYAFAGIAAPILLTVIRIWQGISLGGEYSGNLIYLAESAPANKRATVTALAATGANLGILLASLVSTSTSYFFSESVFQQYGWRLPYLVSGVLSLVLYFTRIKMRETDVFLQLKKMQLLTRNPVAFTLHKNIGAILKTMGLACMGATFYYLCFIYMPTYLTQTLHYSQTRASGMMTFLIGMMIILVPLAGMICDRVGRRKMLLLNACLAMVVTIPGFYFLHGPFVWMILIIFTVISCLEQATTCVAVVENYPPRARYTGLSVGYNLSTAIFGGTAPLVCEWLLHKTQFNLMPAVYIVFCAFVTGVVVFFFAQRTESISLGLMHGEKTREDDAVIANVAKQSHACYADA